MSTTFDPRAVRRWRKEVWGILQQAGFDNLRIPAGLILAGVSLVGTDLQVLSDLTGSSEAYVKQILRRLRKARVLVGQTLRVAWDAPEFKGEVAVLLDMLVAGGELKRFPDPKRSAAQRQRQRSEGPRKPRRQAAKVLGAYVPTQRKADPAYGLAEWPDGNGPAKSTVGET